MCFMAPLGPAECSSHSGQGKLAIGRVLDTLIESHNDVSSQRVLNIHDFFGREQMFRTVMMRAKLHTFVGDS